MTRSQFDPAVLHIAWLVTLVACTASAPAPVRQPANDLAAAPGAALAPTITPPAGFTPGAGAFDDVLGGEEALAGRVAVWSFEEDVGEYPLIALIELYRHESPRTVGLAAWSAELARRTAGVEPPPAPHLWFNYHTVGLDPAGRATAEWAWVPKGERMEVYDHLVATGGAVWHVRLSLQGGYPPELVTGWLGRVFDEPFVAPAPPARRVLAGEGAPR